MKVIKIDASSLVKAACMRRFYLTTVEGYRGKLLTVSLVYGQAVHLFKETYAKTQDENVSISTAGKYFKTTEYEVPKQKEWMTLTHLMNTLVDYIAYMKKNADSEFKTLSLEGEPLVEKKFAIPVYEGKDVTILLCGTIDDLGKLTYGAYAYRDFKTTTQYDAVRYFRQYLLSPQLLTYLWAIKWYGKKYPDSIFGKMCEGRIGAFIEGVFLSASKPTTFLRSNVVFFSEQQLKEYEEFMVSYAERLAAYAQYIALPRREGMVNGACQERFAECPFFSACIQPDDIATEAFLKNNYIQKTYDPLNFREGESAK